VLILRALGLGDFLTGVPAYRALRRAFPRYRIFLAAPAALAGLVPLTGAIDELIPTGELQPVRWDRPPPTIGVDLHGRGRASHRLVAELRPRRLIAFGGANGGGRPGPRWRAGEHEVARWCRLLTESGIPANPADLLLPLPGPARRAPAGHGGHAVIHPGAASGSRRWPPDRFAAVARALTATTCHVLITGTAAERDLALRVAQAAGLPPSRVVAGRTPLTELAALIAAARLVVSGDTGPSHLAVAYRRPSVTLFGPTPPTEWGPPADPRHQVLWPAPPAYRGNPHSGRTDPALAAITVEEVLSAAGRALAAGTTTPVRRAPKAGRPSAR
jgi:ADP-heptose:LPS heptosyltransferase